MRLNPISRNKVRSHRERLRAIQIWVPNIRSRSFAAEVRRQCLAIAISKHAAEDQAFIDAASR